VAVFVMIVPSGVCADAGTVSATAATAMSAGARVIQCEFHSMISSLCPLPHV
jgi:hypothetical protein